MNNPDLIKRAMATTCLAAHHIGEALKLPPEQWTANQFDQISLWLRAANCAVTELQNRAKGNPPAKIGD